ncbi:head-tail adaptor protein [Aureimonas flava]|uniref:Head-tail adaptor protein n=1 Tax=Aureimonas flava TaxID=2320271 RepID=A0A3A1WJG1_9HYPH|nr:phage head closure protein [Aureimonas flava]RIY01289.1 head-tail adaptor protein [Aureimonas flava]
MAPLFIDAGLLRHRAAIERNEIVPDDMGGGRDAWVEVGETSVRLEPLTVEVEERWGQRMGAATHRVTLRARDGLDRGMAFRIGSRRFVIRALQDPDETGRYLVCRCEAEA